MLAAEKLKLMSKILGIDTSNYTTSAALLDTDSMSVVQSKIMLPVKHGEKGIRQSDAVFHHTRQLQSVLSDVLKDTPKLSGIGVSFRPRLAEDSYMPCFMAGETAACGIGLAVGIEPDKTSHQIGHILAALFSCQRLDLVKDSKPFLAFHVSGGTTDMLLCRPDKDKLLDIQTVGCSLDLHAGQVVDRAGVMLGLDFPCGIELEKFAMKSNAHFKIKLTMKDMNCCLSGIENQCRKMFDNNEKKEDIALFCLCSVSAAIKRMTELAKEKFGELPIVYAGGVMSNKIIAAQLKGGIFAEPDFSRDNAVGVAVYSALKKGLI